MTNGDFYEKEIKRINDEGYSTAIVNGRPEKCDSTQCKRCYRKYDIGWDDNCSELRLIEWYNSEYVPPKPKLTKYEKAVLSLLEKGFMARDANRSLYFYEDIPSRMRDEWCSNGGACKRIGVDITKKAEFQFIKWQDEPISIEEMLTWEVEE